MKVIKIMIVMLVLIMSVGAVCAADDISDDIISDDGQDTLEITQDGIYMTNEASFTDLDDEIKNAGTFLELTKDYTFNNETDDELGINITKDNFVLNGEGHTLDGNFQSRIFIITGNNVTLSNINFINANRTGKVGGALYATGSLTLNNVTFYNNQAENGGAIFLRGNVTINNALFSENKAENAGAICSHEKTTINNVTFNNNQATRAGAICAYKETTINNSIFNNNQAEKGGALYLIYETTITNSAFNKNKAKSGGAIEIQGPATITNSAFNSNQAENGGAIFNMGNITTSNVTFINNTASNSGGAVVNTANYISINDKFINNYGNTGAAIYSESEDDFSLNKGTLMNDNEINWGLIYIKSGSGEIANTTFSNTQSNYSTAIYTDESPVVIANCDFINLTAKLTAGAIGFRNIAKIGGVINNCRFVNVSSQKNGGAIFVDASGKKLANKGTIILSNSEFTNCSSEFGGAYLQLAGNLFIGNTTFTSNKAAYNGGAVYLSFVTGIINNCTFDSNAVELNDDYKTYGGGLYCDLLELTMSNCKFTNNIAALGNAIYAMDSEYNITGTTFFNNTNAVYSDFDVSYNLINNTYNNDSLSQNNTFYRTTIMGAGTELNLINNTIDVTLLPSKFDLRDWGWVSPVKDQGDMGSCWTFGATGALESALLKATGLIADFSENNMQNTMLRYSPYGYTYYAESGENTFTSSYLLSWLGAFPKDYDAYDQLGKISPVLMGDEYIHVQDIMFVRNNISEVKSAILQYGSLDASIYGQSSFDEECPYYYPKTYAQYCNETLKPNHAISVIGWDDNFSKDNFYVNPEGDGAWICKNSWGTDWGDEGYFYVSYYDKTFCISNITENCFMAMILENNESYNKNYQYAINWDGEFYNKSNLYSTKFIASENDAIAAVGTYFESEGINYTIQIIVNDKLKLTQNGTSPYFGFHTIKLNEYIPIKAGDEFYVTITSKSVPYVNHTYTRVHYDYNMTFIYKNNEWIDFIDEGYVAFIKVYTKDLAIYTEDLVKIYKNDSKFEVNVGVANATVTFEINGMNYTRLSDENGTARMAINLNPGNYTIKTTFNDTTVENTITVLPTLIADNLVKYYRNASQFFISLIDSAGNSIAGKNITMNINGVFYNRLTNENGTAKLNINLEPGEYILTALDPLTGLQMSYNITVLPVLFANDLVMRFKDGSTFNALVLNGEGNPLANAAVTFNVNGVFYTRHTNSSGIAKLNINLMAGKYIITSEFDGMRISNTITIKD